MNDAMNQLLGLDTLGFGEDATRLGWAHPIPGWAWLLIIIAAMTIAGWSYARLQGPRPARTALAGARSLLLVLIALLASGPRLERERTEIEPDRLVVLLDRSASLGIDDGIANGGDVTRDKQLRAAIEQHAETWSALAEEKTLVWLGFDHAVVELDQADNASPGSIPDALGPRTTIGAAIEEARRRTAAHPLSGILLISDGRSSDALSPEVLGDLQAERVPVHVVPLGRAERGADFALRSVSAPGVAYVDDTIPVKIRFTGENIKPDSLGTIELIDEDTGVRIEQHKLTAPELEAGEITIPARAVTPGQQRWRVQYIPDGPDLAPQNNSASLAVRFVDQPIRVLYVDGSPRWEHRYLKSLLIREKSIDSSCLLLAVNRRYQQEGDTLLDSLPQSSREWDELDVIIIGDISPELFGARALEDIRDHVGKHGAGLLWLAGPTATPGAWSDSPLADLLPVTRSVSGTMRENTKAQVSSTITLWPGPVVMRPTPLAQRAGLFIDEREGGVLSGIDDPDAGWSALRWALKINPHSLKAAAETLAIAIPTDSDENGTPLVISMRYGAGRAALVATDEIWRWRYGRGEPPTERFWLPLIRSLARPRLASVGEAATLVVSPPIARTGQLVSVELTVVDQSIAEIIPAQLTASVTPTPAGTQSPRPIRLTRRPDGGAGRTRYSTTFPAVTPGSYKVGIPPDELAGLNLESTLEVIAPDDELRNPQTDHAFLTELADATGGRAFTPENLADLPDHLPNRRIIVPLAPETATLWDRPLPLIILLSLLTFEWVGRRLIRLT